MSSKSNGGMGSPLRMDPTALPADVQVIDASEMTQQQLMDRLREIQGEVQAAFERQVGALGLNVPDSKTTFLEPNEDKIVRTLFPELARDLTDFEDEAAELRVSMAEAAAAVTDPSTPPVVRSVIEGLDRRLSEELSVRAALPTDAQLDRLIGARRVANGDQFGDEQEADLRNAVLRARQMRGR